MEIIFFGQLADVAGRERLQSENHYDTDTLRRTLEQHFPGLQQVTYMVAVNRKVVQSNTPLTGSETIALMPPFSGG